MGRPTSKGRERKGGEEGTEGEGRRGGKGRGRGEERRGREGGEGEGCPVFLLSRPGNPMN